MDKIDTSKLEEIQKELQKQIVIEKPKNNFHTIAGIDLAYWREKDEEIAVCCLVVLDMESKQVIEQVDSIGKIEFPYIAGCLAFRELPLVLETVDKLTEIPDLYMFDGNGYLHPRHMGIATHASFSLKKPTIGVAKSYYKIHNVDFVMPENIENAYTDIIIENEIYGRALRTHKDVKPIFVSVGNYIDLDTATKIVKDLVTKESHIPLPTRIADIQTHKKREEYKEKNNRKTMAE